VCHGLQGGEAEPLIKRGIDECLGTVVELAKNGIITTDLTNLI